jgi:hypothetical protein
MMRVIVSIFMVVAFEYERERRKYCPQTRGHLARTVLFGYDKPLDRVRLIVLSHVSQPFRADAEPERQRHVGVEIRKRCSA